MNKLLVRNIIALTAAAAFGILAGCGGGGGDSGGKHGGDTPGSDTPAGDGTTISVVASSDFVPLALDQRKSGCKSELPSLVIVAAFAELCNAI